jgi:crotonobetainyl-CoA:carnitine CoA-transferase CaiB-like acyl-CoA transferase
VAHVDEIDGAVAAWIAARSRDEVLATFAAADAAIAPVYDARDILADPHFQAVGTIAAIEDERLGTVRMTGLISRLSETPGEIRSTGGAHGADTDAVLSELGLTQEEIEALRDRGVV